MCGIFALLQNSEITPEQYEVVKENFNKTQHRGPDNSQLVFTNVSNTSVLLGSHRLALNDLSPAGNQPFNLDGISLVCNGEIYNYRELVEKYQFNMKSHSDCEVILHMYAHFGIERTIKELDGYFAFIIHDNNKNIIIIARDIIGVRPLFYHKFNEQLYLSSEIKSIPIVNDTRVSIAQYPAGHYSIIDLNNLENGLEFISYYTYPTLDESIVKSNNQMIFQLLDRAVTKRLMSDRPIGAFLSGGVDSSIVVALLAKHLKKFKCFTVAIADNNGNAIENDDIRCAKMLVEYLNERYQANIEHVIVKFRIDQVLNAVEPLIQCLETWDTTTIRASSCQYLLSTWIKNNTDIKVLYSGEGSDEIFAGYKMFRVAPSAVELQKESLRLVRQLQFFDCLRTDRSTAQAGLEVRVPFLDNAFFDYVLRINPEEKMSNTRLEKYILRSAFQGHLPDEVLWRPKEAFSDSVSNKELNLKEMLKQHATKKLTELGTVQLNDSVYSLPVPKSDEELYYRHVYLNYYPGFVHHIPRYWLPPQEWFGNQEINDPSATILSCYSDDKFKQ